jgi:hypothetical protein
VVGFEPTTLRLRTPTLNPLSFTRENFGAVRGTSTRIFIVRTDALFALS